MPGDNRSTYFFENVHVKTNKIAFHGPSDISPLAHVDFAIPNFSIQEWVDSTEEVNWVFCTGIDYEKGYLMIRDKPGLGVEVDEEAAVHNW